MLLLDGLDEVAEDAHRDTIFSIFRDACDAWKDCVFVVTSRPIQTATLRQMGFHLTSIEPFGKPEIEQFLEHWVRALHEVELEAPLPAEAKAQADKLREAIVREPSVRLIATNPVMLTCLAVVHWNEGALPEGRSRVYQAATRWLIAARTLQRKKAKFNDIFALRAFAQLALDMMSAGGEEGVGKRSRADLGDAVRAIDSRLEREFPDEDEVGRRQWGKRWVEFECLGSGILEKVPGNRVRFWHLTFQEFLAARQLAWMDDDPESERGWWRAIRPHLDDAQWRETADFLPGCLFDEGGEGRVDKLLERVLAPLENDDSLPSVARVTGIVGRLVQPLHVYDYRPPPEVRRRYQAALERSLENLHPPRGRRKCP